MSKYTLPMFFSSFMVSGITFVFKQLDLTLWHVAVQFSKHHLLEALCSPHCIFLAPLS